jgi:hypothetical protein
MTSGTSTPFFETNESGIGRAAGLGAAIGFVVVFGFVVGTAMFAGAHLVSAIAMGAFAGLFGGPGFGGMLGAVTYLNRQHGPGAKTAKMAVPATPEVESTAPTPPAPGMPVPTPPIREVERIDHGV